MELKVTLNQTGIGTLKEFMMYENRCVNMQKETVFVLQAGTNDANSLQKAVEEIDMALTASLDKKSSGYFRINCFDNFLDQEERVKYTDMYQHWVCNKKESFGFHFQNTLWENVFKEALFTITNEYENTMMSDLKLKNFVIMMFKWIALYFPKIFTATKTISKFPKFVYIGSVKTNEYLFFKLLALCGCDVFVISNLREMQIKMNNISFYAQIIQQEFDINVRLPDYDVLKIEEQIRLREDTKREEDIRRQEAARKQEDTQKKEAASRQIRTHHNKNDNGNKASEQILEYVDLARLASSIVMITVYNQNREGLASGSGVLINGSGYILTNFHVVKGGVSFGVRLEEEDDLKFTTELVKYHSDFDLALLRIDPVNRKPIPTYKGAQLARGEKVVAIGSPLGLFNTVSDGIIAGFRNINRVSMIQFTAPTSHGSSGGALLNLYGELVGIVTAGYDDGQNLNLAVDYNIVNSFLRGFL